MPPWLMREGAANQQRAATVSAPFTRACAAAARADLQQQLAEHQSFAWPCRDDELCVVHTGAAAQLVLQECIITLSSFQQLRV